MDAFNSDEAFRTFQKATEELEATFATLVWDVTNAKIVPVQEVAHFTGRGSGWTVQLISAAKEGGEHLRMGTAVKGVLVLKLTDAQCYAAERLARGVVKP